MDLKTVDTTLTWLFERYLEDPNGAWDIKDVSFGDEARNIDELHNLGKHLIRKGLVKNPGYHEGGFTCTITTLGISRVSDGLSEVKYRILQASIEEKKKSMMEMLDAEPSHFQKIRDYAAYLKRLGIIECIFFSHDVYAEPTYFGREWYEANRLRLIN
jgi:hypothetical protein